MGPNPRSNRWGIEGVGRSGLTNMSFDMPFSVFLDRHTKVHIFPRQKSLGEHL